MPAFDRVQDWDPKKHGEARDEWLPQADFLNHATTVDQQTVAQHRAFLAANAHVGPTCACCERTVQVSKVNFARAEAIALDTLARLNRGAPEAYWKMADAIHIELARRGWAVAAIPKGGGPPSHLRLLGLIEAQPGDDGKATTRKGFYRVTREGYEVALGCPWYSHLYTYDGRIWQVSRSVVTIDEAWTKNFHKPDIFPRSAYPGTRP